MVRKLCPFFVSIPVFTVSWLHVQVQEVHVSEASLTTIDVVLHIEVVIIAAMVYM